MSLANHSQQVTAPRRPWPDKCSAAPSLTGQYFFILSETSWRSGHELPAAALDALGESRNFHTALRCNSSSEAITPSSLSFSASSNRPWPMCDAWLVTYRRRGLAGALPLGQMKRLELARALAVEPVILLDEPLAGLNHTEASKQVDHRRSSASGVAVVVDTILRRSCGSAGA